MVSLGGVGHGDLSEGFFGLTPMSQKCASLHIESMMPTSSTIPQPRKHHLYAANLMMSISHMLSSCPHTSGGNLLTQKYPTQLSMAYTTQGHHLTTLH